MLGCLGHLFKAFLGLIFICIMLWVGYKLITEPYHPPKENTSVETLAPNKITLNTSSNYGVKYGCF